MAILRGVSGKVLECGCLVGVYETYGGEVFYEVDAVQPGCARHHTGDPVPPEAVHPSGPAPSPPVVRLS